jgi:uncharacterized membrane protein YbhN (UPF0104 family)
VRKYLRIVVSMLLLALVAWRMDWSEVAAKFAGLRLEMWFAAVALFLVAQFTCVRRWQLFAKELHFEATFARYCSYYFIGTFFSLVLPLVGGDVIRAWYLQEGQSERKWAALGSVFLERVNGLLVLIATACVGVVLCPIDLPWWIGGSVWGSAACAVLGIASLPILKRWQRLSPERRQQIQLMIELLRSPRVLVEATIMSILLQAAGVLVLWLLGLGLGLNVPIAYYAVLGPMVSLLMLLPISINGMGVREAGIVLFLLPLGVDETTSLSLAFLWFSVGATVCLIGGIVYLFGAPSRTDGARQSALPAKPNVCATAATGER